MAHRVTDKLLDRLAGKARIFIPENQRESLKSDIEEIIKFAVKVKDYPIAVEKEDIEPPVGNDHLREDVPGDCLKTDEALNNAPHVKARYFVVPKAIRKDVDHY